MSRSKAPISAKPTATPSAPFERPPLPSTTHHTVEFDTADPTRITKLIEYAKKIGVTNYLCDSHEVDDAAA